MKKNVNIIKRMIALVLVMVTVMISAVPTFAASRTPNIVPAKKEIPITKIAFPEEVNMYVGEKRTVSVDVYPKNTTYTVNITWGSGENSVLKKTINGFGAYWGEACTQTLIGKGVGKGSTYAQVDIFNSKGNKVGSQKFSAVVYVRKKGEQAPLKSINLSPSGSQTLKYGETLKLGIRYNPENTTDNKKVTWTSDNKSIAVVDSNGRVTGKSNGTTTITAKVGTKTAKVSVCIYGAPNKTATTINKTTTTTTKTAATTSKTSTTSSKSTVSGKTTTVKNPLKKITLNYSNYTLDVNDRLYMWVTYTPSNTTERSISWSSSNSAVASVDRSGVITAKKGGTATITAKCGSKTATCKITVRETSSAGKYINVTEAYNLVNKFRTTKANQWYWASNNKTKIQTGSLKKLTVDKSLEETAKVRAKESWEMYYVRGKLTHARPSGKEWNTAYPKNFRYRGENLGWSYDAKEMVLNGNYGWAETNLKYDRQGHRRNMLDSKFTKIGIACYEKDGKRSWALCLGN